MHLEIVTEETRHLNRPIKLSCQNRENDTNTFFETLKIRFQKT